MSDKKGALYLKILKIEICGGTDEENGKLISALGIAQGLLDCPDRISISYRTEERDQEPIQATESTPFSRYLSSTTPEGRTR